MSKKEYSFTHLNLVANNIKGRNIGLAYVIAMIGMNFIACQIN